LEMRATIIFLFCRFGLLFCRARQDACASPDGVSSSPSSCSSYLSCNQLGQVQEMQCEEGMLWNEEEKFCDWKENVSCWKDVIWFIKAGLRFLNIAGRVTKNLVDPENDDKMAKLKKREREENSRKLDGVQVNEESDDGNGTTEDIAKYVSMKNVRYRGADTKTESETNILDEEEEGSGYLQSHKEEGISFLSTTSSKNKDIGNETDDGETETETAKLSETFKQLFLDQKAATEPGNPVNLNSAQNVVEKAAGSENSLPWINVNWVPGSSPDKQ